MPKVYPGLPMLTLACGPFFSTEGLYASIFVLAVVKPLTYFAFIQAFRFRVSGPEPMTVRRAAWLAALRSGAGVALVAGLYWMVSIAGAGEWVSWSALMVERVAVWLVIGWRLAGLRGRRLVGWTLSGAGIDATYDVAIGASLLGGWGPHAIAAGILGLSITALTVVGRRKSLRARFAPAGGPACVRCAYSLAGNVSGICPECGTPAVSRAA